MKKSIFLAIDLKSFYASVECKERNLDALTTNLVVADASKTEKTICLAVSPSLKQYGISGRARLFEVVSKVKEVNRKRLKDNHYKPFTQKSSNDEDLKKNKSLEVDYIIAPPQMAKYMEYSTKIYEIYLKYVSPEDIHVYSIDEVFMDITHYLKTYNVTPRELAMKIILDVLKETEITATAGIGTNLYLCKVAMDIVAKHIKPDKNGVRIAQLDEQRYRKYLWTHKPITDFWRVGKGTATRLEKLGLYTMGDIAKCSMMDGKFYNEALLYKTFGVNAELLIDHAFGYEPCTMKDIHSYKPENNSLGTGQVLSKPYSFDKAKLIIKEMLELLSLDLVDKSLVTDQIVITVGYDIENVEGYHGEITIDRYGRKTPKSAHGTANLKRYTSSTSIIVKAVIDLYERIVDPKITIRRINISANHIIQESQVKKEQRVEQLDLFNQQEDNQEDLDKEKKIQKATLKIKKKYGKNAILKGMNLEEDATTVERNSMIGGHKA